MELTLVLDPQAPAAPADPKHGPPDPNDPAATAFAALLTALVAAVSPQPQLPQQPTPTGSDDGSSEKSPTIHRQNAPGAAPVLPAVAAPQAVEHAEAKSKAPVRAHEGTPPVVGKVAQTPDASEAPAPAAPDTSAPTPTPPPTPTSKPAEHPSAHRPVVPADLLPLPSGDEALSARSADRPQNGGEVKVSSAPAPSAPDPTPTPAPTVAAARVERPEVAQPAAPTTHASPVAQVVKAIAPLRRLPDGTHRVVLELHPAELGTVRIDVSLDSGTVHLGFHAENAATGHLLQQALPELRAQLDAAGLTSGHFGVETGAEGRGHTPGKPEAERPGRRRALGKDDDAPAEVAAGDGQLDIRL